MNVTIRSAILPLLVALCLVACGDDDGGSTSSLDARIDELFGGQTFGEINYEVAERMLTTTPEDDGPFYMVNFIKHREHARYPDGRETDLSGREADDIYGSLILPILFSIGAEPVYVADVQVSLDARDGTVWDQVGVVRYPSYAAFIAMVESDELRDAAQHKEAGVEKSLVLVAQLPNVEFPPGFNEVDLETVPYPPTADDPPIAVIHLISYNERAEYADGRETELTGREAMELYERGRQQQGTLALGVRPGLWVEIEGELIGDGRAWDDFRINNFPSRATFQAVTTQESLNEAGIDHRLAALADTYALLTAPVINQVGYE